MPVRPPTTTFPLPSMVGCSTRLPRSSRSLTRSTRDGLRPTTVPEASFDPGRILVVLDQHNVEYILVGDWVPVHTAHFGRRATLTACPKVDSPTWVGSLMRSANSMPDFVSAA